MDIKFKSICKIDATGRIVVPAVLRKLLGINKNDILSVTVTDSGILLNKSGK